MTVIYVGAVSRTSLHLKLQIANANKGSAQAETSKSKKSRAEVVGMISPHWNFNTHIPQTVYKIQKDFFEALSILITVKLPKM